MATVYLARINPSDYEMVRGILNNDLPNAYEVWLQFQAKDEIDFGRQGHTVGHVKVDPDEIARYHGGHRSHHGLLHFVIKKSEGENY
jgi:hypothetical protein